MKKLKRKILVVATASMLVGGGTTYAAVNYYAGLLLGQEESIKDELQAKYTEYYNYRGQQTHRDMVTHVATTREDLMKEMYTYIELKVNEGVDVRMEEHSKAVKDAAEQLEIELKKYVDEMVSKEITN